VVLLVALLGSCKTGPQLKDRRGQVDGTAFEFSSSGQDLTEEHGSWIVRVRGDAMWVAWFKNGKTKEYGTFKLSGQETNKLWGLIEDAEIHRRKPRAEYPVETPVYSFTVLRPRKLSHTITVAVRSAQNDEELAPLVRYVGKLIKKYAKRKPRLE
jgi:hypothetical protein